MNTDIIILFTVLVLAALIDLRERMIYNWLTLPAIVVGLGMAGWLNGLHGLGLALLGVLIGGGALLYPFFLGKIGGGDVKLMAAVGAIMGPLFVVETILTSIIVGGVIGMIFMVIRGGLLSTLSWYLGCWLALWRKLAYKGLEIYLPKCPDLGSAPFGVSIFGGAVLAYRYDIFSVFLPS